MKPTDTPPPTDTPEANNAAPAGCMARLVVPLHGVLPRSPVPGWQWVKCDDCGTTWKESNRDVISPSHVDCPNRCDHGGDTHVWKYERDEMLERDTSGNLLNPEVIILTRGLGHNAESIHPESKP